MTNAAAQDLNPASKTGRDGYTSSDRDMYDM